MAITLFSNLQSLSAVGRTLSISLYYFTILLFYLCASDVLGHEHRLQHTFIHREGDTHVVFKGTVHPKIKQPGLFWCEMSSFGDIGCGDFCLLSNIMGLNDALKVLTVPQKFNSNVSFQKS